MVYGPSPTMYRDQPPPAPPPLPPVPMYRRLNGKVLSHLNMLHNISTKGKHTLQEQKESRQEPSPPPSPAKAKPIQTSESQVVGQEQREPPHVLMYGPNRESPRFPSHLRMQKWDESWLPPPPSPPSPTKPIRMADEARGLPLKRSKEVVGNSESSYYIGTKTEDKAAERWDPLLVWKQTREFDADFAMMPKKMHRFPGSLSRFRQQYGAQITVPIGPYLDITTDFKMVTMAKNVATHHFIRDMSFRSFDEMFKAFCSSIGDVRSFCDRNDPVLADTNDDSLKLNMLRDGCFLLQYILMCTTRRDKMPQSLVCYFESNKAIINRDIMLLENQLPWVVIQTLRSYKEVPVEEFIAKMARTLQVRKGIHDRETFVLDGSYTPPHLLGLLRFYKIGSKVVASNQNNRFSLITYCCYSKRGVSPSDGIRSMSRTISAMELEEIGIKLKASKTTKFIDMGIKKGLFCSEIFLAPLLLDETRLCWLVNMTAFELCIMAADSSSDTEKDAVCSYIVVLAMLMDREEDVHRLRSKGLVNGELSNKETLDFFKGLVKHISGGPLYIHLMQEIEDYKLKRWMWIKVHKFFYRNYKTIAAALSIIGVLVGIFKALFSLKQH